MIQIAVGGGQLQIRLQRFLQVRIHGQPAGHGLQQLQLKKVFPQGFRKNGQGLVIRNDLVSRLLIPLQELEQVQRLPEVLVVLENVGPDNGRGNGRTPLQLTEQGRDGQLQGLMIQSFHPFRVAHFLLRLLLQNPAFPGGKAVQHKGCTGAQTQIPGLGVPDALHPQAAESVGLPGRGVTLVQKKMHLLDEGKKKAVFVDGVIILPLDDQDFFRNDILTLNTGDQIAVLRQMTHGIHRGFPRLIHTADLREGLDEPPLLVNGLHDVGHGGFERFDPLRIPFYGGAFILAALRKLGILPQSAQQRRVQRIIRHGVPVRAAGLIKASVFFHSWEPNLLFNCSYSGITDRKSREKLTPSSSADGGTPD